MAVFHRALPYNNPKALHLSLLSVLENADQVCHSQHGFVLGCLPLMQKFFFL